MTRRNGQRLEDMKVKLKECSHYWSCCSKKEISERDRELRAVGDPLDAIMAGSHYYNRWKHQLWRSDSGVISYRHSLKKASLPFSQLRPASWLIQKAACIRVRQFMRRWGLLLPQPRGRIIQPKWFALSCCTANMLTTRLDGRPMPHLYLSNAIVDFLYAPVFNPLVLSGCSMISTSGVKCCIGITTNDFPNALKDVSTNEEEDEASKRTCMPLAPALTFSATLTPSWEPTDIPVVWPVVALVVDMITMIEFDTLIGKCCRCRVMNLRY